MSFDPPTSNPPSPPNENSPMELTYFKKSPPRPKRQKVNEETPSKRRRRQATEEEGDRGLIFANCDGEKPLTYQWTRDPAGALEPHSPELQTEEFIGITINGAGKYKSCLSNEAWRRIMVMKRTVSIFLANLYIGPPEAIHESWTACPPFQDLHFHNVTIDASRLKQMVSPSLVNLHYVHTESNMNSAAWQTALTREVQGNGKTLKTDVKSLLIQTQEKNSEELFNAISKYLENPCCRLTSLRIQSPAMSTSKVFLAAVKCPTLTDLELVFKGMFFTIMKYDVIKILKQRFMESSSSDDKKKGKIPENSAPGAITSLKSMNFLQIRVPEQRPNKRRNDSTPATGSSDTPAQPSENADFYRYEPTIAPISIRIQDAAVSELVDEQE
ncbi:hypothetical protein HDV00_003938 [Rhizophlyctis rosea]|nr:hypothetical protein HDV00_003938 [Rhizophlyctis rosea]